MQIGIGIRALIEKQLHDGGIARFAGRDHERRAHVAGPGVDVRAVAQQYLGLSISDRQANAGDTLAHTCSAAFTGSYPG